MADGNLFKRCGCRHPVTGKPLAGGCPKLRRRGGAWNPDHGVWHYQIELPRTAADNPTVATYLTGWLAARKLDENTLRGYESHIRVHIIPHLGRHRLAKLRARHIADMFAAIEARNDEIRAAKAADDPTIRKTVARV